MFVWGFLGLPNLKHILFFSRRSSWHHWAFLKSSPHKKIKNKNKSITRLLYSRATQDLCKTCKTCTGGWGKNKCESTQSGCVYEGFRTFPLQQGFCKHKKNIFFNENKNYTFTNDSQALFEPLPFRDEMEGVCVCVCILFYNTSSILKRMPLMKYGLLKLHKVRNYKLIKDSLPPTGESQHC